MHDVKGCVIGLLQRWRFFIGIGVFGGAVVLLTFLFIPLNAKSSAALSSRGNNASGREEGNAASCVSVSTSRLHVTATMHDREAQCENKFSEYFPLASPACPTSESSIVMGYGAASPPTGKSTRASRNAVAGKPLWGELCVSRNGAERTVYSLRGADVTALVQEMNTLTPGSGCSPDTYSETLVFHYSGAVTSEYFIQPDSFCEGVLGGGNGVPVLSSWNVSAALVHVLSHYPAR